MWHIVIDSDLFQMGFRSVLDERDFPDRAQADRFVPNIEIRCALGSGTVPAILKGWFDRVLSFGFAADTEGLARRPCLRGKKAMLVTTFEAPQEVYVAGSQRGVRELLALIHTLSYVGMTVLPTFIMYGVMPEMGSKWAASHVERLKAHLVLVLTGL